MNSFELDDLRSIGTPVDGKVPAGDPATAWPTRKLDYKLVSPLNRRKFTVIVVGTGLAGAACAASLGELGYHVESFHLPRCTPPCTQCRRARRHQRCSRSKSGQRQSRPLREGHRQGR